MATMSPRKDTADKRDLRSEDGRLTDSAGRFLRRPYETAGRWIVQVAWTAGLPMICALALVNEPSLARQSTPGQFETTPWPHILMPGLY